MDHRRMLLLSISYQHLVALWAARSAVKMGFLRLCG